MLCTPRQARGFTPRAPQDIYGPIITQRGDKTESPLGLAWGVVVFGKDPPGIAFKVFILVVPQAPKKGRETQSAKDQRYRDQDNKDVHSLPFSRSALSRTVIEDVDIAIAAIKGVAKPASAIGTAIML